MQTIVIQKKKKRTLNKNINLNYGKTFFFVYMWTNSISNDFIIINIIIQLTITINMHKATSIIKNNNNSTNMG